MKKASNLFLAIEIIVIIISAVSLAKFHNIRKTKESYAYAQKWNYSINQVEPVYDFQNSLEESEELNSLLNVCIDYYKNSNLQADYPFLFWNNLDDINIYFTEKASEIIGMNNYAAFIKSGNLIIVNTNKFNSKSLDEQKAIVIHELAHALTVSDANFLDGGGFTEAVAEDLACTICTKNSIDYNFTYPDSFCLYMLVWNIFGKTDTLKAYCEGELNNKLNNVSDGYGTDLSNMLTILNHYDAYKNRINFSYNELLYMAQDILVHATVNKANMELDPNHKQYMLDACLDGLIIKNDYFTELLSH